MRVAAFSSVVALCALTTSALNITSLLANTSDLSTLTSLLKANPVILNALAGASNLTIFAPNNAAFAQLTSSGALAAANSTYANFVPSLLQYHVLNHTVYASQISSKPVFPPTLLNSTKYTNVTGGQVVEARVANGSVVELYSGFRNVSHVVKANVNFTGGVVHIIDTVLTIPANVSTTASNKGLSSLAGALKTANLTSTLDTLKDVTVFAPNNAAFQALGNALSNLTAQQVGTILKGHVINGTVAYSPSLGNSSLTTLAGSKVNVNVQSNGTVLVNQARVVTKDILIANGVLHVIDAVLGTNSTAKAGNGTTTSGTGGITTSTGTGTATSATLAATAGTTSVRTGGAMPMATAAMGAVVVGGWAALLAQM